MNILFISYGEYEFDGRLRELIKVAKQIGNTTYITRVKSEDSKQEENHIICKGNGLRDYFKFLKMALDLSRNVKWDILFIDNRRAVLPALIIRLLKKNKLIIYDMRELYLINEVKHIRGKIGCIFEKHFIKKINILICANKFRKEIVQNNFNLNADILVYENLRELKYSDHCDLNSLKEKYQSYFKDPTKINIISTSGWDIKRKSDILVKGMKNLPCESNLFLVGGGSQQDKITMEHLMQQYQLNNVYLIDKVKQDELNFLIHCSQIGVVSYSDYDTNNKYCASGKIYEYVFAGIPVITTENLPLKSLCDTYHIGVSDNTFYRGIMQILQNYDYYLDQVQSFKNNLYILENNKALVFTLNKIISSMR